MLYDKLIESRLGKDKREKGLYRWFWITTYVISISLTIYFIVSLWDRFNTNPTVTSLASTKYPVTSVPFPGIAVCNINKISKSKALAFHKEVLKYDNKSEGQVLQYVKYIGQFHDLDFDPDATRDMIDFQVILEKMKLDIRTVARMLVQTCEEVFSDCSWRGKSMDCSQLFTLRLTYAGYCCTFNYRKRTVEHWEVPIDEVVMGIEDGINEGVSFTAKLIEDDYWYAAIATMSLFSILVFVPTDYPDVNSGSLRQAFVSPGYTTYIEIVPTTIQAVKDVGHYAAHKRGCLFHSERRTNFDGVYSESDCNVACKIRSIWALCQCIPFTLPIGDDSSICTVTDLQCLNLYKDKWYSLAPDETTPDGSLLKEEQDALRCNETCYASCEGTFYELFTNALESRIDHPEDAKVKIFFGKRYYTLYQMDVVNYWFEILSFVYFALSPISFIFTQDHMRQLSELDTKLVSYFNQRLFFNLVIVGNFGGAFGLTIGMCMGSLIEVVIIAVRRIHTIYQQISLD